MPVKSKAQLRAMRAAAGGRSTIGIPKKVAREYLAVTPKGAKLPERKQSRKGK